MKHDNDSASWVTHLVDQITKKENIIKDALRLIEHEQIGEAIQTLRGA